VLFRRNMLRQSHVLHIAIFIYDESEEYAIGYVVFGVEFCLAMSALDVGFQFN